MYETYLCCGKMLSMITKQDALKEINDTQDFYVSKLIDILVGNNTTYNDLKEIDFTSPTGTGKTVMVAKLINQLPEYFFVITSLSKGQLRFQVERKIKQLCNLNNFIVYGSSEYTKNTILQSDDIVSKLPSNRKIVWIRDEGHIATNRWQEVLRDRSSYIINFSATNKTNNGIQCNFAHTMMLRTVSQQSGTFEDALDKLLEVKELHKNISNYNPCALLRILYDQHLESVIEACNSRGLSYINITDEEYDMSEICDDNNEYDVIINKFKITEGIDLKRCHVIYMDTKPGNDYTTIQVIGRARRNALFWRNDIDILSDDNKKLLAETRRCFVYYNIPETVVEQNDFGEFVYSICDTVSVEFLKPNIQISVNDGQMPNGLYVIELAGKTGIYKITYDEDLQANVVNNPSFYKKETDIYSHNSITFPNQFSIKEIVFSDNLRECFIDNLRNRYTEYDDKKLEFYVFKTVFSNKYSKQELDDLEKELNMDVKYKGVYGTDYWNKFVFKYNDDVNVIRNNKDKYISIFESAEALEYSRMQDKYAFMDGALLFVRGKIQPKFFGYIKSIKYLDMTPAETIKSFLDHANNIKQKGPNSYLYSSHPLASYFKYRFRNLDFKSLKKEISHLKQSRFCGCKIEYIKNMFSKIKSYEEIDEYDCKTITLSELNKLMFLGLTNDEIKQYLTGEYKTIVSLNPKQFQRNIFKNVCANSVPKLYDGYEAVFYSSITNNKYHEYEAVVNDKELAVYGPDTMRYIGGSFVEDKKVTSKIAKFSKLNTFIERRYKDVLDSIRPHLYSGHNNFDFDRRCNSCLGFCVECFAKLKLFPNMYEQFFNKAMYEGSVKERNDYVYVRAAILAYRYEMEECYGKSVVGYLPSISIDALQSDKYSSFVAKVVELGNVTANFVLKHLFGGRIGENQKLHNPDLSVKHISALCDFITNDTILDVKCTSSINERYVKQVLAYHYLSTKRSDLNIKRLILFDPPTNKYIEITV